MIFEKLRQDVLSKLNLEVFDIDNSTTAAMVLGWDSLSHVRIIMVIEGAFGTRFGPLEATRPKNGGELQNLIDRHVK